MLSNSVFKVSLKNEDGRVQSITCYSERNSQTDAFPLLFMSGFRRLQI